MMNNMKNNRKKFLQQEYVARINRAIDFIEKHIDSELNLDFAMIRIKVDTF